MSIPELSSAAEDTVVELQKINAAIIAFVTVFFSEEQKVRFSELYRTLLNQARQSTSDEFEEGGEG